MLTGHLVAATESELVERNHFQNDLLGFGHSGRAHHHRFAVQFSCVLHTHTQNIQLYCPHGGSHMAAVNKTKNPHSEDYTNTHTTLLSSWGNLCGSSKQNIKNPHFKDYFGHFELSKKAHSHSERERERERERA